MAFHVCIDEGAFGVGGQEVFVNCGGQVDLLIGISADELHFKKSLRRIVSN